MAGADNKIVSLFFHGQEGAIRQISPCTTCLGPRRSIGVAPLGFARWCVIRFLRIYPNIHEFTVVSVRTKVRVVEMTRYVQRIHKQHLRLLSVLT